jgi:hypothetical protein
MTGMTGACQFQIGIDNFFCLVFASQCHLFVHDYTYGYHKFLSMIERKQTLSIARMSQK